jgi:4-aminobutyrate aminotransferase-like enzyme
MPSAASSSYGGNPLAATAAWISLEIILEENLVENSRRVGAFLLTKLIDLQEKYPFIGQVQGRGLMIGMELVKDQRSKEPLESHVTEIIFRECLNRGLLAMSYSPHFRLNPPLTLTQDQAQAGAAILDEVFAYIQREVPYH